MMRFIIFAILWLVGAACSDTEYRSGRKTKVVANVGLKGKGAPDVNDPSFNPQIPGVINFPAQTGDGEQSGISGNSGASGSDTSGASGGGDSGTSGVGGASGDSGGSGEIIPPPALVERQFPFSAEALGRVVLEPVLRSASGFRHPLPINQVIQTRHFSPTFNQGLAGTKVDYPIPVEGSKLLDILVVVDVSVSMGQEAGSLADNLLNLIVSIPDEIDWQIKIVPHKEFGPGNFAYSPLLTNWYNAGEKPADWKKASFYRNNAQKRWIEEVIICKNPEKPEVKPYVFKKSDYQNIIDPIARAEKEKADFAGPLTNMRYWIEHLLYDERANQQSGPNSKAGRYGEEGLFYAASMALNCTQPWLRDNSTLAVLFASDQDDDSENYSKNLYCSDNNSCISKMKDLLVAKLPTVESPSGGTSRIKGRTAKAYALIGNVDGNPKCGEETGTSYEAVVADFGGIASSLCGDFSNLLQNMSENISATFKTSYSLMRPISVPAPITFTDANSQSIQVNYQAPQNGDSSIQFTVAPDAGTVIHYYTGRTDYLESLPALPNDADMSSQSLIVTVTSGTSPTTYIYGSDYRVDGKVITFTGRIPPDNASINVQYYWLSEALKPTFMLGVGLNQVEVMPPYALDPSVPYNPITGIAKLTSIPPSGALVNFSYWDSAQDPTQPIRPLAFTIQGGYVPGTIAVINGTPPCSTEPSWDFVDSAFSIDCPDVNFSAGIEYQPQHPGFEFDTGLSDPDLYSWKVSFGTESIVTDDIPFRREGAAIIIPGTVTNGRPGSFMITATPK